jgi:hypothetical protein
MQVEGDEGAVGGAKSKDSGLSISLHPLVIINISDHSTRFRALNAGKPKRVLGVLLGKLVAPPSQSPCVRARPYLLLQRFLRPGRRPLWARASFLQPCSALCFVRFASGLPAGVQARDGPAPHLVRAGDPHRLPPIQNAEASRGRDGAEGPAVHGALRAQHGARREPAHAKPPRGVSAAIGEGRGCVVLCWQA